MATLDEQLDKITKAPLQQKIAVVVLLIGMITAGNYFLLISPQDDAISGKIKELHRLEDDYIQKQAIANNLNQFKKEKESLERRLAQALTELPNEANIDDLVRSVSEVGVKSGLNIARIEPQPESSQGFYAAIPLLMSVSGNYHEIGVFFDSLSKLPRIVNVSNLKLGHPHVKNEKEIVDADFVATTFRFLSK